MLTAGYLGNESLPPVVASMTVQLCSAADLGPALGTMLTRLFPHIFKVRRLPCRHRTHFMLPLLSVSDCQRHWVVFVLSVDLFARVPCQVNPSTFDPMLGANSHRRQQS